MTITPEMPQPEFQGSANGPALHRRRRFKPDRDVEEWRGPYRPYDLIKEVVIAFVIVGLLVAALAIVLSSPDEAPVTIASWSGHAPVDFAQTAITELDGSSATATYGPPYNATPGASQSLGPLSLERLAGVHIPIDTAQTDVLGPLASLPGNPAVHGALRQYDAATAAQRQTWAAAYERAVSHAVFTNGRLQVPAGQYGPVALMMSSLEQMAQSGALDGALLRSKQFYGTDYTKPLLFIADGTYMANLAQRQHLAGDQWGMMNETGSYPGQAWLWLYTLWYQVPPMNTSGNGDVLVWAIMMGLTLLLIFLPFIPGLRSIPRAIPIYRLIWRRHYQAVRGG